VADGTMSATTTVPVVVVAAHHTKSQLARHSAKTFAALHTHHATNIQMCRCCFAVAVLELAACVAVIELLYVFALPA